MVHESMVTEPPLILTPPPSPAAVLPVIEEDVIETVPEAT
jgi:hypothetical protein